MGTVVSTSDVHQRDAFDYWHKVLCQKLIPHECTPESPHSFHGTLRAESLGDVGLVYFESSPKTIRVPVFHDRKAGDPLFVRLQLAGKFCFEHCGRNTLLEAGNVAIVDPRHPMHGKYYQGSRQLALKVPRREVEARIGDIRPMTAYAIEPSITVQGLTCAYIAMLPTYVDGLDRAALDLARDHLLDLVALTLAKSFDRDKPRLARARSLVLLNVSAAIEAHLTDPSLDASKIAAAAGIGVRYANSVLAEQNTSIMRSLLARRLERCRQALADSTQAHRTISEIAYGWGFSDMTHFSRRFRATYGMSPRDYRKLGKPRTPKG